MDRTSLSIALMLAAAGLSSACEENDEPKDAGHPDPADYAACEVAPDCVVVPASCCGSCGAPVRGDAVAIAEARANAYRSATCGEDGACPACAPLFVDPTLVATCRDDRCELVDLREHEASACSADSDCRVRTPECCPCGGDTSVGRLVGVSSEDAYASLVCDPDQACPECAFLYPDEVTVRCNTDDHCEVHDARIPGSDAGGPDAGRPSFCSLPPDSGPCEAYMPRYHFDSESGRCTLFIYGGCEGNDNRFESALECATACDAVSPLPLAACEVDGVLHLHGEDGFGDPVSCNTCSCSDGALVCTDIACDEPCPSGQTYAIDCAQCGPVDNCEVVRTGCVPSCDGDADCDQGSCQDGACVTRCG
jgi:hypothetical protein